MECESLRSKEREMEFVAFHVIQGEGITQIMTIPFFKITSIQFIPPEGIGPKDLDFGAGIPNPDQNIKNLPYLKIRKPEKFELYSDIAMCGYPSGSKSLNLIGSGNHECASLNSSP